MNVIDRIRKHAIEHGAPITEDSPIRNKRFVLRSAGVDTDKRLVKGIAGTAWVDMEGEVVVPDYDDSYFKVNRAVFLEHNYGQAIGTCRNYTTEDGGLYTTTYIASTALGEEVLTLCREEVIRGLSVGVLPIDHGPPGPEEIAKYGGCVHVIRRSLLLEYSVTAMPCNPQALITAVSKNLCRRATAVMLGLPDTPERKFHPVTDPTRKKCVVQPDRKVCRVFG